MNSLIGSRLLAGNCLEEGFHLGVEVVNLVEFGHPASIFQ